MTSDALAMNLKQKMGLFAKAFDLSLIEYQLVFDAMVTPFLLLAKNCQEDGLDGIVSSRLRDSAADFLFSAWASSLSCTLSWHSKSRAGRHEMPANHAR